jgi:hypothetical protein
MKYAYARVSTDDQSAALQFAALKRAGCKTLFKGRGLVRSHNQTPCSSLIAIVVGGYEFAHGEPSAKKTDDILRTLEQ